MVFFLTHLSSRHAFLVSGPKLQKDTLRIGALRNGEFHDERNSKDGKFVRDSAAATAFAVLLALPHYIFLELSGVFFEYSTIPLFIRQFSMSSLPILQYVPLRNL